MTKIEELNRKMLDIEKRGLLSEDQYRTYKQLLEAVVLLEPALRLVDAHRRYALGEGDITAMNIRSVLESLK